MTCAKCRTKYELRLGIPILIDLTKISAHLQKQINYFNEEDARREGYCLEAWQQRYIENYLSRAGLKEGSLVIDNATGSGYFAIELAKRHMKVIATDLTFNELFKLRRIAKKLGLEESILALCCSSEELPIKNGIADGLVANAILEHLPRENQAIAEIHRVLKSGARVMVAMPLAYHLLWPLLIIPNWLHDRRIGHLRRYTKERILEKFGRFREITTYYTGSLPKVICLALYILTGNSRWNNFAEILDEKFMHIKYGASNIVMILSKI